ncbi:hypothetical protein BJY04DRAFT_175597 [Aspergillus karnatakaensis]|uniref:uncharacterized protein n=1 Tax=Aspergillus karnatakaensis TaxID=1810916 RepID=UPI003CCC98E3
MPPKKANAKRAKKMADSNSGSPSRRSARLTPNMDNTILPNIPTKTSFGYGSSATPILPHMMRPKAQLNLHEMADTIEEAVQEAKDREDSESAQGTPNIGARRRRKSVSQSASPPRRTQREPTPDETQLHQTLEASVPREKSNSVVSRRSSVGSIPSIPTRHSFSTVSSPGRGAPAQQLYPRGLQKSPSPIRQENPLEIPNGLGLDNESVISYNVERDVHDDDLQRTRTNITAPPRRFSGLAFPQATIEEEDEPQYQSSRSPSVATSINEAPARTIIPDRSFSEPLDEEHPEKHVPEEPTPVSKKDYTWLARLALVGSFILWVWWTLSHSPNTNTPFPGSYNNTGLDMLSNQVGNLGSQVSSLSKDVKSVKTELSKVPAPTTIYHYPSKGRQETLRTNFLALGHGVIIDPYKTSPSLGVPRTWFQRFYMWIARGKHIQTQPPLAALTPWEDFGECWCSAPRKGMSQIGILLGRRMIPEDVVVEHMPKSATLTPEVAPKHMELWARYRYVGKDARPYRRSVASLLRNFPDNISGQDPLDPDSKKLRGPVMEALRMAWKGEPDSAFADDELLGPHYYRIAKWTYDINDGNHVQTFPVNARIDSDQVRVDKVIFRVNSNWGSNATCIYRLKMYGKL